MTTIAPASSRWTHTPKLRLVPRKEEAAATLAHEPPLDAARHPSASVALNDASLADDSPILVAGSDTTARAEVLRRLAAVMPAHTRFHEVESLWEILVHAPTVRMVAVSGGLDGIPTESILHMLGNRHPELPVISLDAPV